MSKLTERILFLKFVRILKFVKIRELLKSIKFESSIYGDASGDTSKRLYFAFSNVFFKLTEITQIIKGKGKGHLI